MVNFLYGIGLLSLPFGIFLATQGRMEWLGIALGVSSALSCCVLAKFLSVLEEIRDRLPAPKEEEPKPSKAEIVAAAQSLGEEQ